MKPAYRPRVRIYRGQRAVPGQDCCPMCGKKIGVDHRGKRYTHGERGHLCPGSRLQVEGREVSVSPDDVLAALPTHGVVRLKTADECPDCGRRMPRNTDGSYRKHRADAEMFVGPYCPGGAR